MRTRSMIAFLSALGLTTIAPASTLTVSVVAPGFGGIKSASLSLMPSGAVGSTKSVNVRYQNNHATMS